MNKKDQILVTTEDVVKVGNAYYFVARNLNVICKINVEDSCIDVVGIIPEEDLYQERVCSRIYVASEKLIFLPMNGSKIWIYSTNDMEWQCIEIENSDSVNMKLMQAIEYKNKLYLVGCFYPAIVVYDMVSGSVDYIRAPYIELEHLQSHEKANYFRCDFVLKEGVLYLASCLKNCILKLSLDSYEWVYISVGNQENKYSGIGWDGNYFWLSPRTGNFLVRWDGFDSVEEYEIEEEKYKGFFRFNGVICKNNTVFFPARDGKKSYEIENDDFSTLKSSERNFLFYKVTDAGETISGTHDGIIRIKQCSGVVFQIVCYISDFDVKKIARKSRNCITAFFEKRDLFVEENPVISIKELCICSDEVLNRQEVEARSTVGSAIWTNAKCAGYIWNR